MTSEETQKKAEDLAEALKKEQEEEKKKIRRSYSSTNCKSRTRSKSPRRKISSRYSKSRR